MFGKAQEKFGLQQNAKFNGSSTKSSLFPIGALQHHWEPGLCIIFFTTPALWLSIHQRSSKE